jgi:hypothetical protein
MICKRSDKIAEKFPNTGFCLPEAPDYSARPDYTDCTANPVAPNRRVQSNPAAKLVTTPASAWFKRDAGPPTSVVTPIPQKRSP